MVAAHALRARKRFLEALAGSAARATQGTLLDELVRPNRGTAFGREHDFQSIRTLDDYRAAVPIRHFDELAAWIERSAGGEAGVLTAEEPIRFWKTTGTTSTPKKIPVTPTSHMRTMESFLTLQGTQLHYHPEINERADTSLVTHISPKTIKQYLGPRKVPYCSTTEVPVEVRKGREDLVAPWLQPLQNVVEDDAERLYFLLCFASLHDLYNVTCLHPSRFQTVASTLDTYWQRLVAELREGTILGEPVRDPEPARADELEAIARERGGLRPRDVWPNLTFIASWSGSYIRRYRPIMEEAFCTGFLPMPSISSEAFATMTVDDNPIGQPLNLRGALFEFIPAIQKVEPGTPTLEFHELSKGESYEIVLSTLSGLYRYAMCDIFKVIDFVDEVPRLEYIGRRSVSDLTGEKLAEEHVLHGVGAALAHFGASGVNYTVCGIHAQSSDDRPRYVLVVETAPAWDDGNAEKLADDLDARFLALNSRYELKRNFGDLRPLEVAVVAAGTFQRYRELLVKRGMPAGQLKDKVLYADGASILADLRELSNLV